MIYKSLAQKVIYLKNKGVPYSQIHKRCNITQTQFNDTLREFNRAGYSGFPTSPDACLSLADLFLRGKL